MKKNSITEIFRRGTKALEKRSPEILIGFGIASGITTTILAIKATPKALEIIENEERKKIKEATIEEAHKWSEEGGIKFTPIEYVRMCWRPYIPTIISGTFSIACIIGASSKYTKRNAALATACQVTSTALHDFKEISKEVVGEEKVKEIEEKVAKEKTIPSLNFHEDDILYTGDGNIVFHEPISNQVFKSSKNAIIAAQNSLNYDMCNGFEPYKSFNEFLDAIKIKSFFSGDDIGWASNKELIDITFAPGDTNAGIPCYEIVYLVPPKYEYDDLRA